ncbi:MAG: exopolysaccharide biosynthesis protein [Elusimicrobia bacterium]|nr:exopolysaccharide biosynthesis protein [Elusimicrobiota bacterium]
MAAAAHLRRLRGGLDGALTLGELAARLGRDGTGLLLILLAAPFLQPLPTAGLCVPAGLLIAAAGLRLARGGEGLVLPRFASERTLEEATLRRLLSAAEKIVGWLERAAKRRGPDWARSPRLIGWMIAALGAGLALPIYVPLGATVCAAPILLLGLALIEEDGACGLLGLLAAVACVAYHAAFARLAWVAIATFLKKVR